MLFQLIIILIGWLLYIHFSPLLVNDIICFFSFSPLQIMSARHRNNPSVHPVPIISTSTASSPGDDSISVSTDSTALNTLAPNIQSRLHDTYLSSSAPSMGTYTSINPSPSESGRRNSGSLSALSPMLSIEFEGGSQIIIRPNRIIRGKVILNITEKIHFTRIRIKFRAEESAMVKVDEGTTDGKGDWIHSMITTYFETEWKLLGQEISRMMYI
ncbi:hypothetical protein BDB01DRAFT_251546 [Pilobolus umbonatus]|nr:hypothetical protein BDB01DRAFT_251546 [Pilobolus umbonatus]